MTTQEIIQYATRRLKQAGIGTARLDCLVFLEDVTGIKRAQLLAHPEVEITQLQLVQLQKLIKLRSQHVPLAYIRGKSEFYGREFVITKAVLEPRPESETMIDLLKEVAGSKSLAPDKPLKIADIGTGSGALGITAALELPGSEVALVDIDENCLQVAAQNCARFELDLLCIVDNLLAHASKRGAKVDIILTNLPYVPDDYQINTAALHEPKLSIFGGQDGLDLYRRLFMQCEGLRPKYVLTESLPFQHAELQAIAHRHGYHQAKEVDFIQLFAPVQGVQI